jgi:hypothetical protein
MGTSHEVADFPYTIKQDKLIPFYNEPFSSNWMFSNMLHSAYSDRQGNLWLATRSCTG